MEHHASSPKPEEPTAVPCPSYICRANWPFPQIGGPFCQSSYKSPTTWGLYYRALISNPHLLQGHTGRPPVSPHVPAPHLGGIEIKTGKVMVMVVAVIGKVIVIVIVIVRVMVIVIAMVIGITTGIKTAIVVRASRFSIQRMGCLLSGLRAFLRALLLITIYGM